MTEKKEERIFDKGTKKPSEKEIKVLLKKAGKVARDPEKKETPKETDKMGLILNTLEKYTRKVDNIENILSAKDSEQQKSQTQDKPTSEELLRQVQVEQDKEKEQGKQGQPGQQPGQTQQLTEEQYKKMSNDEKVPLLEAQLRAQQGNPNNYEKIMQGINAVSPVVIEAMRQNKSNSGSIGSFFENLKIYSGVENAMLGNVFRLFKYLSPTQQRQGAQNIIEQAGKLPDFPELPPINEAHIGE